MLSWEELERQRQAGMLGGPMAQPLDPQFGIQPFGLEASAAALKPGTMPGDPSVMRQSTGYGHRMTFDLKRRKERGSMGIAQPHQPESATGDMPVGRKNNMGGMLKSLFA